MYSNVNAMGCYPVAGKITKEDVGLGNVDNTSDLDKPISNAMREIVDRMEQAVTDVNEAVETANEASESAQESAETVAGYNSRLSSAEIRLTTAEDGIAGNTSNILTHDGEITSLQSDVNRLDGDITDITNDMTNMVRKVSNTVQNVNKGLTFGEIPDDGKAGVTKDYIDGYEHMVRTSDFQIIDGDKIFNDKLIKSGIKDSTYLTFRDSFYNNPTATNQEPFIKIVDGNDNAIVTLAIRQNANGSHILRAVIRNSDGETYKTVDIASSD